MIRFCQVGIVLLLAAFPLLGRQPVDPAKTPQVRLVVLLVFDQLRGDYLTRWQDQFGKDGFRRLVTQGVHFTQCHYPYAHTVTAAGHASMATGCMPCKHGIVGNSWYDREERKVVGAINSDKHRQFPPPPEDLKITKLLGVSPKRRLQPSVADALKDHSKGKAKVVVLSIKDRSAALLAGMFSNLVAWFSALSGEFVTSSQFGDGLPPWLERFNKEKKADRYFGKDWTRFRPDLDYDRLAGPDDADGEAKGVHQGKTFPHPTTGDLKTPGPDFYDAVTFTPFGNDLLADLGKAAVIEEKLGQGEATDLLCLSFSSNDLVGHSWGPDSQEVFDMTLRSDRLVGDLLAFLDDKVGQDRYAVVVCSDHGVCPLVEKVRKGGGDSGRIDPRQLGRDVDKFLDDTFGGGAGTANWIEELAPPWIYLDQKTLKDHKLESATVEKSLCAWLAKQKGIRRAYSRSELMKGKPDGDQIDIHTWRSFHPERSGDVEILLQPYWLLTTYISGTTHGTPYQYDTHVPLLVMAPGLKGGARDETVTPLAVAPILAHYLGVPPPAGAEVGVPKTLLIKEPRTE